jgi:hypothetical protein
MKATLEFENRHDLLMAVHGAEACALLSDIDMAIRTQLKHGESGKDRDTLESIRADIRELLERTYV